MAEPTIVMSCIFGKNFKKVYSVPVPIPENCLFYFFTNNPELKNEIVSKGWNYVYVDFELSDDPIISSLQSKYIKFLLPRHENMMPKNHDILYSKFFSGGKCIYFDHKFNVDAKHMRTILELMTKHNDNSVIIRTTPRMKNTLWDEVNEAIGQHRYRKNMSKTVKLINERIVQSKLSENVRICNTGILIYNNPKNMEPMLKEIYDLCIELEQPECQIIWGIVSQKYEPLIKKIEWSELSPLWTEPQL
jgi:hypothetical protein